MEQMKGFVEFKNKKYPFSFSNEILEIFPNEFSDMTIYDINNTDIKENPLKKINLIGTSLYKQNVIFEVSPNYSYNRGFMSFEVYSIYKYKSLFNNDFNENNYKKEPQIRRIKFRGTEVNSFFSPMRLYSMEYDLEEKALTKVKVNKSKEISLGKIFWKNIEISFTAKNIIVSNMFLESTPFHGLSEIIVTFNKSVSLEFFKEIYDALLNTFRYITRRKNVIFDDVEVFDINKEEREEVLVGRFYKLRNYYKRETNNEMKRRILNYDCLGEQFADLVKAFLEGIIYIDHLPNNINQFNKLGPDRRLFDFVAFEREYSNIYPENIARSDNYKEAKKCALNALNIVMEEKTGKVRKYIKSFIRTVEYDDKNLSDRLLLAIEDCEEIIKPFLEYELGKEYNIEIDDSTSIKDITIKMNILRNDMAHGNLGVNIDEQHIHGFNIIESLLYVMRLKALGIEKKKIQEGVNQLMGNYVILKP